MDERLRDLERAAIEDPSQEPAYLRALIHAGLLDPYHVAYAAFLGYEPAENLVEVNLERVERAASYDRARPDALDNKLNAVIYELSFYLCASMIVKCFEYSQEDFEEIVLAAPLVQQLLDNEDEDEYLIQRINALSNEVRYAEQEEYSLPGGAWWRRREMQEIFPEVIANIIDYWRTFTIHKTTEEHVENRLRQFRSITKDYLRRIRDFSEGFADDMGYRGKEGVGWNMALEYQVEKLIELLLTPDIHIRRNPDDAPIIVIGMSPAYEWQMRCIIDDLDELGWDNLLQQMLDKNYEVYDMATQPEKGDARNHIQEDTPLIIAMHLFGIDPHDQYKFSSGGYFYNQNNYMIYRIAEMWNIPLMVFGDQPDPTKSATAGKSTLTHQYFTDKAN